MLGEPRDAVAAADLYDVEAVAVASHPDLAGTSLRRLAWALEERDIDLIVSPGLLGVAGPRLSIRPSTNLSLLHIERPSHAGRSMLLKARWTDPWRRYCSWRWLRCWRSWRRRSR